MQYETFNLGVSTADARDIAIHFDGGNLSLSFVDWQERPKSVKFRDVLAFRWQEFDDPVPRDDETFVVAESSWLDRQARLQSVLRENFVHYVMCFNTCGVLDVLAGGFATD